MNCGDCGRVLLSSTRRNRNCCEEHAGDSDPHDQYLLESEYTAASVLERLLTVDGSGSGLDSDFLDGLDSTAFSLDGHTHIGIGAHTHAGEDIISGLIADLRIASTIARDLEVMTIVLANDGAGSGLDADLLDGLSSAAFALSSHVHAGEDITSGTVADDRIASTITRDSEVFTIVLAADGTGSLLDADLLDGLNSSAFALASHTHTGEDITSGTIADARIASTITRDSEVFGIVLANDGSGSGLDADLLDGLSSAAFALVSHAHAGEDITSGTVADARIASTITRDSEVVGIAQAAGVFQPIDADLTAIAALTTTAFGRARLVDADAAALRSAAGLGTMATATEANYALVSGARAFTVLSVTGAATIGGAVDFPASVWHTAAGSQRLHFASGGTTYIKGYGSLVLIVRNATDATVFSVLSTGATTFASSVSINRASNVTDGFIDFQTNLTSDWAVGMRQTGDSNFRIYSQGITADVVTILRASGNVGLLVTAPTALLHLAASTTARAQFNLTPGTDPTSPNNGDVTFDGTNIKIRVAGAWKTFTLT